MDIMREVGLARANPDTNGGLAIGSDAPKKQPSNTTWFDPKYSQNADGDGDYDDDDVIMAAVMIVSADDDDVMNHGQVLLDSFQLEDPLVTRT